jgi:glutathione S-transferase
MPLVLYGSTISYFTGKLEAALRYKEIDYRLEPMRSQAQRGLIPQATGVFQMPAFQLEDGRWLTDSTLILQWLDQAYPAYPLLPQDPVLRFVSLLLEDYADEWLWRPAMHYRWHYAPDAACLSRHISQELLSDMPGPLWLKQFFVRRRQRRLFTAGDGVSAHTQAHVEGIYLGTLTALEAMFANRSFMLGARPSLVDIGFFGPMFRHFSQDPTAAALMQERAPHTQAWVDRMWASRGSQMQGDWVRVLPQDFAPLLREVGQAYMPYLLANAQAVAQGHKRFNVTIQGCAYQQVRTSRYRLLCLEMLQHHFAALSALQRVELDAIFAGSGISPALRAQLPARSGVDVVTHSAFSPGLPMLGL